MHTGNKMLSESKFFMGYSRWDDTKNGYESWDDSVDRVMNMHKQKYAHKMTPELTEHIDFAQAAYKDKLILGAQRALQFGGEQIFKHEARLYNCSSSYADRPAFFNECMYLMLCGVGVGFSVGKKRIAKLPTIARRSAKKVKIFQIPDSIEGWADAFGVLLSSYFTEGATHPEYRGCQVHFDYTKIRPEGAKISGGFKAPGPDGLRKSLIKCEDLLERLLTENHITNITSIAAYDFVMHMSDAVLSGGVRRSATICVFDKDDQQMLTAKTGNWFAENPQRARSNNSALIIRDELSRDEWKNIMKSVKDFGEPGFIFADSDDFMFNPCVTGDTLVTVCDHGTVNSGDPISNGVVYQIPMKLLVELFETSDLPPMIVSYNTTTGKFEYDLLTNAFLTRKNTDVIKLTMDDGSILKCTPDHKIFTENRGWIEAKELTSDDVLIYGNSENIKEIKRIHLSKIEIVPNEDVYDITVKNNHNFLANGIVIHNCVEVGMLPETKSGVSGFQFCNLTTINGGMCVDKDVFLRACKASAILGTLQAGYTDFKYVSEATKEITDREALIGCSITGWMNNPDVLFDKENMVAGATLIKEINKEVASIIGINQAARATVVKPEGNSSVILSTASGIHGEHSPTYFRHVQMNINDEVAKLIKDINPKMVENSVWSANGTDIVVAFPVKSKEGSIYKSTLLGVKQLEYVKLAQQYWIEYGTNVDLCTHPKIRHNVSNTITVDDWVEVEEYLYNNREWFAGVSLLASSGDKAYAQAPFTEVKEYEEIVDLYGKGALFASGLIIEALHAYNQNLWLACDTLVGRGLKLTDDSTDLLKRDWLRRAIKFSQNYFDSDIDKMTNCLKDCYNLHKWESITRSMKDIDFSTELQVQKYVDVDGLGAQGCAGGACEISF